MKSLASLRMSVVIIIALFACPAASFAQSASSFQASATIVTPSTVEKLADLEFLNVPADRAVTKNVAGKGKIAKAKASQPAVDGSVTAAAFTVTGNANYVYGVTMPSTVTKGVGNRTVTIGTFFSAASSDLTLSSGGTDALSIVGTLSVKNEPYADTNAVAASSEEEFEEFPVTIIYN
jgi:hypothetical protein